MNKTFYVIRILLAFLIIVSSFSCKKEIKEEVPRGQLWVTTEKGLWLRETPNVNGKQIILIPFKEMVYIYEITDKDDTVAGVTDRWGRVKYNDKMGWAFRGFLNNVDPNNQEDIKESVMDADGKFLIGTWEVVSRNNGNIKYFKIIDGNKINNDKGHYKDNSGNIIQKSEEIVINNNGDYFNNNYSTTGEIEFSTNAKWKYYSDDKRLELASKPSLEGTDAIDQNGKLIYQYYKIIEFNNYYLEVKYIEFEK
jgi:hypothetical protein